jgi:SAM-dependent methyltransferase
VESFVTLKQRFARRVVGQFMHPHGIGGHISGWVMTHRSSNRRRNGWVVTLLDVQPGDRVLDVGFGPGIAIGNLARVTTQGVVIGIDRSETMVRLAQKRNAAAVRTGRVDLRLGSVEELPDLGAPVDKILSVNSMGFWPDPAARLRELRSNLSVGGVIAIASQPRCPGATRDTSAKAASEIEAALRGAGFSNTRVETLELDPPVVCVIGANDGAGRRS